MSKDRMTETALHSWDVSATEAREWQCFLSGRVIEKGEPGEIRTIAGCDLAFDNATNTAIGALVLLDFPSLKPRLGYVVRMPVPFPYVPGLLSFREGPVILELFRRLERLPDLVFFDGQGRAHPRGLGVASHLGLWLDLPSIGVAKSILYGHAENEPGPEKGSQSALVAPDGRHLGQVLRTKNKVKPLYISVGHKISLEAACRLVMACVTRYRLPEPTRLADRLAARAKQENRSGHWNF